MNKVAPSDAPAKPTSSKSIVALVTMAAKILGLMSRKLERRTSTPSSEESVERAAPAAPNAPTYQQSSTRRLAFGNVEDTNLHKPLNDFYNNSTLTNVSKLFCAAVLITAFVLVMTHGLQFVQQELHQQQGTHNHSFAVSAFP